MLAEGRRRAALGDDVVVGLLETHGRTGLNEAVLRFETIARRSIEYRGVTLGELDVDAVTARRPDVVLVDELAHSNMPGSHRDKRWQDVDVLIQAGIDVITTLNVIHLAGANDCVTKPFGMDELMARLRGVLRDVRRGSDEPVIETGDFTIDLAAQRVLRDGRTVPLTRTEWHIVQLLARNPGRLITHSQLIADVWGLKGISNNYVRVFMVTIRRKLEPDPAHPRYFITEPGSGVRFAWSGPDRSAEYARARLGLSTGTVVEALSGAPLVSPWQAAKLQRIAAGEFSPQFPLSLALKDVRLALQTAGDGRPEVLACLADEWQRAVDQGLGEQDLTVVTQVIDQG